MAGAGRHAGAPMSGSGDPPLPLGAAHTSRLVRALLVVAGSASVMVGVIGLFVPVLPSTVFFLLAAACYVRSSERMYRRLITDPRIGPLIYDLRVHRAMPRRAKITSLAVGWLAIGASALVGVETALPRVVLVVLGLIMTVAILGIRTLGAETGDDPRDAAGDETRDVIGDDPRDAAGDDPRDIIGDEPRDAPH